MLGSFEVMLGSLENCYFSPPLALETDLWCIVSITYLPVSGLKHRPALHSFCYRYPTSLRDTSIFPGWWPAFCCMRKFNRPLHWIHVDTFPTINKSQSILITMSENTSKSIWFKMDQQRSPFLSDERSLLELGNKSKNYFYIFKFYGSFQ